MYSTFHLSITLWVPNYNPASQLDFSVIMKTIVLPLWDFLSVFQAGTDVMKSVVQFAAQNRVSS